ncbi:MAG: hypothetical protein JSW18_06045 [Candidatus Omnitrophota bacterium]|nr:MAG: hypothetical protein JSW18_06045 [Candidatus Omnitrophota bacterium]
MKKEPIITIPTYWTRKGGVKKVGDTYFDHPTALDGEQTLTRLLDSLKEVWGKFKVVILTGIVDYSDNKLYEQVEKKVDSLIKPYKKHFPIMQFAKSDVKFLKERMKKSNMLIDMLPQINLACYPTIRNCQLMVTNGLGSDVMIGLDDDEVVMRDHVKKATEFIGKEYKGQKIYGIGGYYKDKKGDHIMRDLKKPPIDNIFYRKRWIKNEGFIAVDRMKGRVQKSNFVFGGNMVMHRKMFMNVAYDLGITRGENMDYLINAKMHDLHFYFDKELYIIHMPPEKWDKKIKAFLRTGAFSMTNYYRLEQDMLRFIYEREKIRECNDHHPELKKVSIDELKPYPGDFFEEKVVKDAVYALKFMYPEETKKLRINAEVQVNRALERARKLAPNYFLFNQKWIKLMKFIGEDKEFKKHLESGWL